MKKYKINKGFISQKIGKNLTIFGGEESTLYTFNETGTFIFQKLKLGWDKRKITEAIIKRFKVDKDKVRGDLNEFIEELTKKKIIQTY